MKKIKIRDTYITLGQFLKYVNAVSSGFEAKMVILDGLVLVNNEVETRRGKKLYSGDIVTYDNNSYEIQS